MSLRSFLLSLTLLLGLFTALVSYEPAGNSAAIKQLLSKYKDPQWYSIHQYGEPIGHYSTELSRNQLAQWVFDSKLNFRAIGGTAVAQTQQYVFAAQPPYALIFATQNRTWNGQVRETTLVRQEHGFSWQFRQGQRYQRKFLTMEFSLTDHLGLELALAAGDLANGSIVTTRHLQFAEFSADSAIFCCARVLATTG